MEKLQAALNKAREARAAGQVPTSESRPRVETPASASSSAELQARWQALSRFDVAQETLEQHRVFTHEAGASATPFDILRTKILLQMRREGWKRLAITSPMPKSGKTTMACNLALGLGRQKELRSVLLDLDLRDPSVQEFFEHRPPHGIGAMLRGDVPFAEQALRIGDNVAVSMAQGPEADPTRLLLSEETAETLNMIEAEYQPDVMIFDLPSVLVNDDTRAFLKNADCALIVIRAGATRYGQFDACEREIAEQTNVLGVVLNAYSAYDVKDQG